MNDFIQVIFHFMFGALGLNPIAPDFEANWKIEQNWQKNNDYHTLIASSSTAAKLCTDTNAFLILPQVVHSAQKVWIDKKLFSSFGDPSFKKASPFYFQMQIPCAELKPNSTIQWEVTTYSSYFARIRENSYLSRSLIYPNFFNTTANVMAFGILIVLSIFTFIIYKGRVSDNLTFSVSFGAFSLALYFANVSNQLIGINFSMLTAHKLADVGLWLGGNLFLKAFYIDKLISHHIYRLVKYSCYLAISVILLGQDGDSVQFGTMIPMVPYITASILIITNLLKQISKNFKNNNELFIKFIAVFLFVAFGINDILQIMGIINSLMMLSIGNVGCVLGLSIAVIHAIKITYQERDDLLAKLEFKVQEKTQHLQAALEQVKAAQGELVQSAKLASLGTLSAGIAHEINNSINYVNGALIPLERRVMNYVPEAEKPLIQKLLNAIKEGTHLTVDIVKSLRTYTGLNQAELKEFYMIDALNSVTTILKSKLTDIQVEISDPQHISIYGHLVSFNQIFMNLITNSIDAFDKDQKKITIHLESIDNQRVQIKYSDNGPGIPTHVLTRVFDPFFTTKEVGKGTGLGLHIVKNEIEKHNGEIKIMSEVGIGTTFVMILPLHANEYTSKQEVAA